MNAENEMAGADGLGASPDYAERLRRLRELIDDEDPSDGIHNEDVQTLFDAGGERECICAETEERPDDHADGCPMGEALPECPRFLACTSEGTGESSYRTNPDFFAGDRDAVGEWLAGSYNEGWACNWVVDLDTGQAEQWQTAVLLGPINPRTLLGIIAAGVPREDEWDSAADFMEAVAEGLDRANVTRPEHYPED